MLRLSAIIPQVLGIEQNTLKQMTLTVNGEPFEFADGITVRQLLVQLDRADRPVAVERNKTLVSHRVFDETVLADGDVLEVVTLVGGG
ncbi:sulfur carrier protein ThiS [Planctomycetales bacterium]|nr:sulfur carrier protein ThiS [Planctomycetales bacterium]